MDNMVRSGCLCSDHVCNEEVGNVEEKGVGRLPERRARAGQPAAAEAPATLKLRLMETTDIHVNIVNYDYYQDAATDEFGLAKTAALIKQAREEVQNSLLFDNGDLIQGNPLGDYVARMDPLQEGDIHPVYKAMNLLDYDAGNIGNHEFNYGLNFLRTSLGGARFPYVNANVYIDDQDDNPDNDQNYFTPYLILDKSFTDENGSEHPLKVGVIGFVPPQIMQWDKAHLEGKVVAKDIVETAKKFVPEMKEKGADIIVAIPHSGFGSTELKGNDENATYHLSRVAGIDAILFGHSHVVFPGPAFEGAPGVDKAAQSAPAEADRMVAARATAEANGIDVAYDFVSRKASLSKGEIILEYTLRADAVFSNGSPVAVKAEIVNDRLYLPESLLQRTFAF